MTKYSATSNIIGRTLEGRYPIGRITLEQGRIYTGQADHYKSWDKVGLVSVQAKGGVYEDLVTLYRNGKNQLMYMVYKSGSFYPIIGRVLKLEGNVNLVNDGKAYYIDQSDGRVKIINRRYKFFTVMFDSYDDAMLVFKCTNRVDAEIVFDNAIRRGCMNTVRVLKNIPHMTGSSIKVVFYTKDTNPYWYEIGAFSNSTKQANKEGSNND